MLHTFAYKYLYNAILTYYIYYLYIYIIYLNRIIRTNLCILWRFPVVIMCTVNFFPAQYIVCLVSLKFSNTCFFGGKVANSTFSGQVPLTTPPSLFDDSATSVVREDLTGRAFALHGILSPAEATCGFK